MASGQAPTNELDGSLLGPNGSFASDSKIEQGDMGTLAAQTRFSFYEASDFASPTSKEESVDKFQSNRFLFYDSDAIQKISSSKGNSSQSSIPIPSSQEAGSANLNDSEPLRPTTPNTNNFSELLGRKGEASLGLTMKKEGVEGKELDSIEILRSLQEHEHSGGDTGSDFDKAMSTTSTNLTTDSNPYEEAIKEALLLLRKHRSLEPMSRSATRTTPSNNSHSATVTDEACMDAVGAEQNIRMCISTPTESDHVIKARDNGAKEMAIGDPIPSSPTGEEVSSGSKAYQSEIEARRKQRQERMARYATRLAELKNESPGGVDCSVPPAPSGGRSNVFFDHSYGAVEGPFTSSSNENENENASLHINQKRRPFPSREEEHGSSGETTDSKNESTTVSRQDCSSDHSSAQKSVQVSVEKVLLAILDRASSAGRGGIERGDRLATASSGDGIKTTPSADDYPLQVSQSSSSIQDDALLRAMSELLQQSTSSGSELVHDQTKHAIENPTIGNSTPIDTGLIDTNGPRNELGVVSSASPTRQTEAHAELDRVVDSLSREGQVALQATQINDTAVTDLMPDYLKTKSQDDELNERVRRVLALDDGDDDDTEEELIGDRNEQEEMSESGYTGSRDGDGTVDDTLEDGLESDSYDEEGQSKSTDLLNGVLGPLSRRSGGTTGVVLEPDTSEESASAPQSILDSISAAARNLVTRSTSQEKDQESNRESVDDDSDLDSDSDTDSQMNNLMYTLCAHLLFKFVQGSRKRRLMDRIPEWDESNPDEPGYRIIRLNSLQLRAVEEEFSVAVDQMQPKISPDSIDYENDLGVAEKLLDKVKLKATSSPTTKSRNINELECLDQFPGVKPAGCGEMGDLEFFHLPIIFKSHVTGFEPTKDMYLEAGNVVAGQYLVEGELGSAAFSTAYRCIDLNSEGNGPDGHEEVCLKVIKNTKDFFDQSLDEIKILELLRQTGQCDEANILKMKTFFYHREHLIIVTELLRQNLFEFGKFITDNNEQPYFTISRLSYITRQALVALEFVHNIGLVHSDVKPENILLASYSRAKCKLIDFGSSCYLTDRQSSYIQSRSYRAPEVIIGLPYDGRIDVWSLGCVVAEMFTGEVTFQNDSIVSMLCRIEAICGPLPKRMIDQGRQSAAYYTKSGLLFEKVKQRRSKESSESDESSSEQRSEASFDIFQPKRTSLAMRLGLDENLIASYDAGRKLSRDLELQAIFIDFVRSLLTVDPENRPSATEALKHPWMEYAASLSEKDIKYP